MFSNLTASYDPIFWPIHANIDRLWWEWQQQHPDRAAGRSRFRAVAVELHGARHARHLALRLRVCALLATSCRSAWRRRSDASSRSRSRSTSKVKSFRKAEVRLHRVPQLLRSCFIRVFLNQPGADATHAGARQSALCRLSGDLRPRRMLRRSGPLRPAAAARARLRPAPAQPQHAAQPPHRRDRRPRGGCSRRRDELHDHAWS